PVGSAASAVSAAHARPAQPARRGAGYLFGSPASGPDTTAHQPPARCVAGGIGHRRRRGDLAAFFSHVNRTSMAASFESKILDPDTLLRTINEGSLPRPLVFTNGVFDILHRGHATYLDAAAQLGATLVVALNTDASVRRLGKEIG